MAVVGPLEDAVVVARTLEADGIAATVGLDEAPRRQQPDVLVITAVFEERELALRLENDRTAAVLVVAPRVTTTVVRHMLEAGAHAILPRAELVTALGPAVRAVLAGLVCAPRELRKSLSAPALSTRERQVLALMAGGLTNAEIAEQLFVTESTVKSHAVSAFRRLGVHSRREAVAVVLGASETLRRSVLMSHPGGAVGARRDGGEDA